MFRGQSVGRCSLLGVSKSGFGVGNPPFELLAGSAGLGNLCVSLLKLVSSGGRCGQLVLSDLFERCGNLPQLLSHSIPSRSNFSQSSFVLSLLFGELRGRGRQRGGVALLGLAECRFCIGELLPSSGEVPTERCVLCNLFRESSLEFRQLSFGVLQSALEGSAPLDNDCELFSTSRAA